MADPIREYEQRIRHYFSLQVVEVKEEPGGGRRSPEEVMAAEGERLLARVPPGSEVIALDRRGTQWSSEELAHHLESLAVSAHPGATLVIGGAYGLSPQVLERGDRRLWFSAMPQPHERGGLVNRKKLYGAGRILRGEP